MERVESAGKGEGCTAQELSVFMEEMGFSECHITLKRDVIRVEEYLMNSELDSTYYHIFISGSRGEGSDVTSMSPKDTIKGMRKGFTVRPDVDIDMLMVLSGVCVLNRFECERGSLDWPVRMVEHATNPAYVYLYLLEEPRVRRRSVFDAMIGGIRKVCARDTNGRLLLSSEYFNLMLLSYYSERGADIKLQGPAVTKVGTGPDRDIVHGFPCWTWPRQADEWVSRRRHGWPHRHLVEEIKDGGCVLIPVGDVTSSENGYQWRLSFSFAERLLVWSLNNVQIKCYGLLKLLKHIALSHLEPSVVSSYHIKTVLFWTVEESEEDIWVDGNLDNLVELCLAKLKYMVTNGCCPHYFVIRHNLFYKYDSVFLSNLRGLVCELKDNWRTILLQKCFTQNSASSRVELSNLLLRAHIRSVMSEFSTWRTTVVHKIERNRKESFSILSSIRNRLNRNRRPSCPMERAVMENMKAVISGFMGTHILCFMKTRRTGNIQKYQGFRTAMSLLCESIRSDVSSGRLKLAWNLYSLGLHLESLNVVDDVLNIFYASSRQIQAVSSRNTGESQLNVELTERTIPHKFTHELALGVIFPSSEFDIASKPIRIEMLRSRAILNNGFKDLDFASFDSIAFAHFLKIILFYELNEKSRCGNEKSRCGNEKSHCSREISRFQRLFVDCPCQLFDLKSDLALLGYCHKLLGDDSAASEVFRQIADMQGGELSAEIHTADMRLEALNVNKRD